MESLDFRGIQPHALGSENSAMEGNLRLPDAAHSVIEDNTMFFGGLH